MKRQMNARDVIGKVRDRLNQNKEAEGVLSRALGSDVVSSIHGASAPESAVYRIYERCKQRGAIDALHQALGTSLVYDVYQASARTGSSGEGVMTRARFDSLSPRERMRHIKDGGTIID